MHVKHKRPGIAAAPTALYRADAAPTPRRDLPRPDTSELEVKHRRLHVVGWTDASGTPDSSFTPFCECSTSLKIYNLSCEHEDKHLLCDPTCRHSWNVTSVFTPVGWLLLCSLQSYVELWILSGCVTSAARVPYLIHSIHVNYHLSHSAFINRTDVHHREARGEAEGLGKSLQMQLINSQYTDSCISGWCEWLMSGKNNKTSVVYLVELRTWRYISMFKSREIHNVYSSLIWSSVSVTSRETSRWYVKERRRKSTNLVKRYVTKTLIRYLVCERRNHIG